MWGQLTPHNVMGLQINQKFLSTWQANERTTKNKTRMQCNSNADEGVRIKFNDLMLCSLIYNVFLDNYYFDLIRCNLCTKTFFFSHTKNEERKRKKSS